MKFNVLNLLGNGQDTYKVRAIHPPLDYTSKCQPMNVCLNRPLKAMLRKCWVNYTSNAIKKFPSSTEDPNFKIPTPTRQEMIDWVDTAYQYLSSNPTLIQNLLEVCGITSSDPKKSETSNFINDAWKRH